MSSSGCVNVLVNFEEYLGCEREIDMDNSGRFAGNVEQDYGHVIQLSHMVQINTSSNISINPTINAAYPDVQNKCQKEFLNERIIIFTLIPEQLSVDLIEIGIYVEYFSNPPQLH